MVQLNLDIEAAINTVDLTARTVITSISMRLEWHDKYDPSEKIIILCIENTILVDLDDAG